MTPPSMALVVESAVVGPELTIQDLTRAAREGHTRVQESLLNAFEAAIATGAVLTEIRDRLSGQPGAWSGWLADEWGASKTAALRYVRLAHYSTQIVRDIQNPTLSEAYQYMEGLPHLGRRGQVIEAKRKEAMRLRRQGVPAREIAELLSIHPTTLTRWTHPKAYAKRAEAAKRRRDAALRAYRENEAAAAARAKGGAPAKCYTIGYQFRAALAHAEECEDDPAARKAFRDALHLVYGACDKINEGMATTRQRDSP